MEHSYLRYQCPRLFPITRTQSPSLPAFMPSHSLPLHRGHRIRERHSSRLIADAGRIDKQRSNANFFNITLSNISRRVTFATKAQMSTWRVIALVVKKYVYNRVISWGRKKDKKSRLTNGRAAFELYGCSPCKVTILARIVGWIP